MRRPWFADALSSGLHPECPHLRGMVSGILQKLGIFSTEQFSCLENLRDKQQDSNTKALPPSGEAKNCVHCASPFAIKVLCRSVAAMYLTEDGHHTMHMSVFLAFWKAEVRLPLEFSQFGTCISIRADWQARTLHDLSSEVVSCLSVLNRLPFFRVFSCFGRFAWAAVSHPHHWKKGPPESGPPRHSSME